MKIVVSAELEVNIKEDRANANEIFCTVSGAAREFGRRLALDVVEQYQERVVEILCSPSGRVAKKGLGAHELKGGEGRRCRRRTFKRAGYWKETRRLRGESCSVEFRPAMVECVGCGKRLTPVLDALGLESGQTKTEELLRRVTEAVAETSYRRGSDELEVLTGIPVAKSTAHRWAASVELPVNEGSGDPFLLADGTGFKRQPGERGDVRLVLEIGENGRIRPLGVWAGTPWKRIYRELKSRLRGQKELFVSDGEKGLEGWLGRLAKKSQRCHWHLTRDSGYALWRDGAPLEERKQTRERLSRLLAVEIPEEDVEFVSPEDRKELRQRIKAAENELDRLRGQFEEKGYEKAAAYLHNAHDRLFSHLRLWLQTGLIAPRATSIIENIIRELVRRLKKIGWNWSDPGATRMGRIVMMRRYDEEAWAAFWRDRMNLQGRCEIDFVGWKSRRAA